MALTRQKAAIQMETIWTAIDLFKFNNHHPPLLGCLGQDGSWRLHPSCAAPPSVVLGVKVEDPEEDLGGNPPSAEHTGVSCRVGFSCSGPCWVQEQRHPERCPPRSHSLSHTFAEESDRP